MKTVCVMSQKGGSGKTTIAIQLAVAADHADKVAVVIDLDPQASASSWKDSRAKETPIIVSAQAARLQRVMTAAQDNATDLLLIDTAPHSESSALAAARAADLILIPCRPSIMDLRAIGNTIDLVRLAQKPAFVVLNAVASKGTLAQESVLAIQGYNVEICPIQLGHRAAFINSLTLGQSAQEYDFNSKAAAESTQLYKWICTQVGL